MYRNLQECRGIKRNVQECTGMYRNKEECTGMYRNVRKDRAQQPQPFLSKLTKENHPALAWDCPSPKR